MRLFYFCFLICFVKMTTCTETDHNFHDKLEQYLEKKKIFVEEQVHEKNIKKREVTFSLNVKGGVSKTINQTFTHSAWFRLLNNSFIILNNNAYFLREDHLTGETFKLFEEEQKISLVEVKEHNGIGFLVTAFESGIVNIYNVKEDVTKFELVQSIGNTNVSDIHMFVRNSDLYLVVSNNEENHLALTNFYKWTKTYFDKVEYLLLKGVNKVSTFQYESSEIVILAQENLINVYDFNSDGLLKTQEITSQNVKFLDNYTINKKRYIVLCDDILCSIFWWSGSELLDWAISKVHSKINRPLLMYSNSTPIILDAQNDKLLVYSLSTDNIKLIGKSSFESNFTNIVNFNYIPLETANTVFITGETNNHTEIHSYEIQIIETFTEDPPKEKDVLLQCLTELKEQVFAKKVDLKNKIDLKSRAKSQIRASFKQAPDTTDSKENIETIKTKVEHLQNEIQQFKTTDKNLNVNGKVIVKQSLSAENLNAKNVNLKSINGKNWTPEKWLSYSQSQTISGFSTINKLIVEEVTTTPNALFFNDLAIQGKNQILTGTITTQSLNTKNLKTAKINNIPFENIYLKSNPVDIKGIKQFTNIKTNAVTIKQMNGEEPSNIVKHFADPKSRHLIFDQDLKVKNLEVSSIDNVHWNTFKDSVFRIGVTNTITGNLVVPKIKTTSLTAKTLSGEPVDNLMTLTTDQTIDSTMEFPNVLAQNINVSIVNGVRMSDVATIHDPIIKGPVRMDNLEVLGDLELNVPAKDLEFLMENEHIVGTNESDLLQIYHEKVKIKGNLILSNLSVLDEATFRISGIDFDRKVHDKYWTKSTDQSIPVHFEAENGIVTPHLLTRTVNALNVEKYMLNTNDDKPPTNFYFENVTIAGNLYLSENENHSPDLNKIDAEAVKLNGSFVINGKKTYKNMLKIKNLHTDLLNDVPSYEFISTKGPTTIKGKKHFEGIVVKGNLTANEVSVKEINGINLEQVIKNTIYVDQPFKSDRVTFNDVFVKNLKVTTINGGDVNKHGKEMKKTLENNVIENLMIAGDLTVQDAQDVKTINGRRINDVLLKNDVEGENTINANVVFNGDVKIKNLLARFINGVNFENLTSRILYKQWNQQVTAPYTFKNVKTQNLNVPKVNDVSLENLVDVKNASLQKIVAPNGIQFADTSVKNLNSDKLPCDFEKSIENIRNPPTQNWANIFVAQNVTFMDEECKLKNLFKNAVTTNREQAILQPVHFSGDISTKTVRTARHINGINLQTIIEDALLKNSKDAQLIRGNKIFTEEIDAYSVIVQNNTEVGLINKVEVMKLSKKIIMKDQVHNMTIRGKKTFFGGLQTDRLISNKVSNIIPENLVTTDNLQTIPEVMFENVKVDNNLNVHYINDISLDYMLNERLLCNESLQAINTSISFDNVEILGNVIAPSINGVNMSDVVYDVGTQVINSFKTFTETVNIDGNAQIERLNGFSVSEEYEKAVLKGEATSFKGNLKIMSPSVLNGNIKTKYLNGYPMDKLAYVLSEESSANEKSAVGNIIQNISTVTSENIKIIQKMPSEFMYIEKSNTMKLSIPNALSSQTITSKGHILMHITGQQPGTACGLPEDCRCPMQHTIQISPQNSVYMYPNQGAQRSYSFDNKDLTIRLITNTTSTSPKCRLDPEKSKEQSTLTWATTGNSSDFFSYNNNLRGYISGAEFFTVNDKIYAVIGQYFDPLTNNHNISCTVFRFSSDKTTTTEVQVIPTTYLWSLNLFYTAQGVVLIISSEAPDHDLDQTTFMRFNETTEQFETLRTVPGYGCLSSTGIVLKEDSFIALAHKERPLLIFKYSPQFDNYYFYQSLQEESSILAVSAFYTGGFGISDAYLCTVSKNGYYSIYSNKFVEGWVLEATGEIDGLTNLIPFELNKNSYLFAPSNELSTLLSVVKHGYTIN